jgi:hypothetical protein
MLALAQWFQFAAIAFTGLAFLFFLADLEF